METMSVCSAGGPGGFSVPVLVGGGCALRLRRPCAPSRRGLTQRAGASPGLVLQVSSRQRREQQRQEKKKRQEERHRHKAMESRGSHRDNNRSEAEASAQVTLVKTFAALNI